MKFLIMCVLLASCASKASNEIEALGLDVLKAKQGIDIEIQPIPKLDAKKS